jgi:hypothetical protein
LLQRAAAEHACPLNEPVSRRLEKSFANDFSRIKVHGGPASADAARSIGARAYTLGTDIHLGAEAHRLGGQELDRLLIHEAVHTLQQGGRPIRPCAGVIVSNPNDAAEREAERIADSIAPNDAARNPPGSLGSPGAKRVGREQPTVTQMVAPQLQRDLTGEREVKDGKFDLDLKEESHPGAKSGLKGTIKFNANKKAPDSDSIRLLQVVRTEDLRTGKDYVFTGADADRNKVRTTAEKGRVEEGFFVDHKPAAATPRTAKGDAPVSPYYRDYWPNPSTSRDGSKKRRSVAEASLSDYPGANFNARFSFETIAKAADTGYVYGTVMWGFTISDASKGTIEKQRAEGRDVTLLTTDKAIEKFDEFYKNPGSSTAP